MSAEIDLRVPSLGMLHARRSAKWSSEGPGVLAMTIAEMDFPVAPPIAAALRAAIDRHDLGYAPAAPPGLQQAFAGFARRRMDWEVDPEQVVLVPDVVVGLRELCQALIEPGDSVALATPAYPPFFSVLPGAGLRIRELATDPRGDFELDDLEAALRAGTKALLLVNPHNPSGRVIPRQKLARIAEICAAHEAWVLADEIHAPLVLDGATHTPWLELSEAAREFGIVLISATKAFNLAGLKAAQLVTASPRAREAVAALPPLSGGSGLLGVIASEAAFDESDAWLDAVLDQLAENRDLLAARLAADLPEIRFVPPQGTYLAWLDCRALGLGEDPAARFLARGRVALSPGPSYGTAGAGFARLNFATSPELLEEGVRRMAAAVP
jgi:cystathionine beta-lyase